MGVLADGYRNMSDAGFSAEVLSQPSTVFGFGDVTLTRGRPITFGRALALPLLETQVHGTTTVEWRDAAPGEITMSSVSTVPDPVETEKALIPFVQKVLAGVAPDARDQLKAAFAKLPPMTMTDDLLLTLDAQTGLPRKAEHRTGFDMGLVSRTRVESYSFAS